MSVQFYNCRNTEYLNHNQSPYFKHLLHFVEKSRNTFGIPGVTILRRSFNSIMSNFSPYIISNSNSIQNLLLSQPSGFKSNSFCKPNCVRNLMTSITDKQKNNNVPMSQFTVNIQVLEVFKSNNHCIGTLRKLLRP